MAKEWKNIPEHLARFAMESKVFFIASCAGDDDINLSPKGVTQLKVLDNKTVVYADYHGSGDQSATHMRQGGKATLAFMSFDEKPLILRFYCTGRVAPGGSAEFNEISSAHYPQFDSGQFRQIFIFDVYRVQTSCGYGVPIMEYKGDRKNQAYFKELLTPQKVR